MEWAPATEEALPPVMHASASYKKRFPAQHRRRKRMEQQHAPQADNAPQQSGLPAAVAGILDWADSALADIDASASWEKRKRRVADQQE